MRNIYYVFILLFKIRNIRDGCYNVGIWISFLYVSVSHIYSILHVVSTKSCYISGDYFSHNMDNMKKHVLLFLL